MPLTNKEIVQKLNGFFSESNIEAFLSYCTDNIRWIMAGSPAMVGKDAVRKGMEMEGFEPSPLITVRNIVADGDLVACEGSIQMTKKTGELHHAEYCDFYRFSQGLVNELTSYVVDLAPGAAITDDAKEKLRRELKTTKEELLNSLEVFKPTEINAIPFEGSWSAAQVADHVLKSMSGALLVIKSKVQPTARNPGEKVEALKKLFLDFSIQMKSPEEILPSMLPLEKDFVINSLKAKMEGLQEAAENTDLSATCSTFEFPGFGLLTGLEWLKFSVYHTRRHTTQIKNIHVKLSQAG